MEKKLWCAVYVNSRSEKKVLEALTKKNITAYVPLVKTMKQWSDRKKILEVPLLNGYVFIETLTPIENDKIIQTKGVVSFVKSAGKIALIRDEEIERLKQFVELGYQLEVDSVDRNYIKGNKVKIVSGVLKNVEGYISETSEGRFIELVLESIGQVIRVKLPKEILLPI